MASATAAVDRVGHPISFHVPAEALLPCLPPAPPPDPHAPPQPRAPHGPPRPPHAPCTPPPPRPAAQTPTMIADLIASTGELCSGAGYLLELGDLMAQSLREASIAGQAVGAAAQKDLDAVAALIKAHAAEYASSSKAGATQAAAVLKAWAALLGSQEELSAAATQLGVLPLKLLSFADVIASLYQDVIAWGDYAGDNLFGYGRLTYKR
jgi:hypothetical protein